MKNITAAIFVLLIFSNLANSMEERSPSEAIKIYMANKVPFQKVSKGIQKLVVSLTNYEVVDGYATESTLTNIHVGRVFPAAEDTQIEIIYEGDFLNKYQSGTVKYWNIVKKGERKPISGDHQQSILKEFCAFLTEATRQNTLIPDELKETCTITINDLVKPLKLSSRPDLSVQRLILNFRRVCFEMNLYFWSLLDKELLSRDFLNIIYKSVPSMNMNMNMKKFDIFWQDDEKFTIASKKIQALLAEILEQQLAYGLELCEEEKPLADCTNSNCFANLPREVRINFEKPTEYGLIKKVGLRGNDVTLNCTGEPVYWRQSHFIKFCKKIREYTLTSSGSVSAQKYLSRRCSKEFGYHKLVITFKNKIHFPHYAKELHLLLHHESHADRVNKKLESLLSFENEKRDKKQNSEIISDSESDDSDHSGDW